MNIYDQSPCVGAVYVDRQDGRASLGPVETSQLGMLTSRLEHVLSRASDIDDQVSIIARRLGGSVPMPTSTEGAQSNASQVKPPRIDEMNLLVDMLQQTLNNTSSEVQRLRKMVD